MKSIEEWINVTPGVRVIHDSEYRQDLLELYKAIQLDALREAAEIASAQSDLTREQIPNGSFNSHEYFVGFRRGSVNAANAIFAVANNIINRKSS